MKEITFLTLAEVVEIHADQIQRYSGGDGVRDMRLLSSAVAMPSASFSDTFLHPDIYEMAAAYAFHISQNHPFIDGNKRTALAATFVFLELNRISVSDDKGNFYNAMMALASGDIDKYGFAKILKELQG